MSQRENLNLQDEEADEEEGVDPQIILADERYEIIGKILCEVYQPGEEKWSLSDLLDSVFLHRYLGLPIFLVIIWAMFHFTFGASLVFMEMIESFFAWLGSYTSQIPVPWLASLLTDGIIGGVGFILVFLPPILFMYLAISILEDSGYLARAAFVMDRLMVRIGLHGRSFIPMLLGFGCSVPAIMAARTVDGESNRLTTILVSPLMSCAARLPVYVLIAGVFFPDFAGTMVFLMYILGIIMAVLMALVFKRTLFQEESSPLIMELPTYQMPTLHGSLRHAWERGFLFMRKAGTYLLVGAMLLWVLANTGPAGFGVSVDASFVAIIGRLGEPLFSVHGFPWQIVTALIFGLLAKEVVVESLGIIFSAQGDVAIGSALLSALSPLSAFALMVFVLLYTPCIATVATIRSETGSWKWAGVSVAYQVTLAFVVSLVIVLVGGLFIG
ncbi:MAG: ferrous iron transport protein B [Candidatus Thorarchaeota archaeon]|nr:ferrous iron transport protein B [Candidatus Thorarchaeota archaeon]